MDYRLRVGPGRIWFDAASRLIGGVLRPDGRRPLKRRRPNHGAGRRLGTSVAIVVWIFGLSGPFVDYMLMAIPFFIALPVIGAWIGELYGRSGSGRRRV